MNQPVDDHRRNQIKHTNHVFDLYHMCNRLIIAVRVNMKLEWRINKKTRILQERKKRPADVGYNNS